MSQDPIDDRLLIVSAFLRLAQRETEQLACRHALEPGTPYDQPMQQLTACLAETAAVLQRFRQAVEDRRAAAGGPPDSACPP